MLDLSMGPKELAVTEPGLYTETPNVSSNPVTTGGSGTGAEVLLYTADGHVLRGIVKVSSLYNHRQPLTHQILRLPPIHNLHPAIGVLNRSVRLFHLFSPQ